MWPVPKFPHSQYGPMALRSALRRTLAAGEDLIAWGVLESQPEGAALTMQIGLRLVPILGPALEMCFFRAERRLAVLTDARLLVFDIRAGGHGPARPLSECSLGELRVGRRHGGYRVTLRPGQPARAVRLPDQKSRPSKRLAAALASLSEDPTPEPA